jgi:hypothetical protein
MPEELKPSCYWCSHSPVCMVWSEIKRVLVFPAVSTATFPAVAEALAKNCIHWDRGEGEHVVS